MNPTPYFPLNPITRTNFYRMGWMRLLVSLFSLVCLIGFSRVSFGDETPVPSDTAFTGDKSTWHGFDRYDFLMDEESLAIKPTTTAAGEGAGYKSVDGQRRCIVVVPKTAAPGNPWSWRGCYWDHQPQTEIELLKRGFHIAFVAPDAGAQG